MASQAQAEWVLRVLGVEPTPVVGGDARAIPAAIQAWRAASERVDGQVAALQVALRQSDDPDLHEIAEFGMAALSGGNRTRLMALLVELERTDAPSLSLLKRAAGVAGEFRAHIASDPRVRGFDTNPFGVAVSIRTTLTPALEQIESAAASGS
jgi:hypothetical protein